MCILNLRFYELHCNSQVAPLISLYCFSLLFYEADSFDVINMLLESKLDHNWFSL